MAATAVIRCASKVCADPALPVGAATTSAAAGRWFEARRETSGFAAIPEAIHGRR
jgi:hypothetical protein